jgi:transcriptional regulator with GAF, ATPase, and Fis domain
LRLYRDLVDLEQAWETAEVWRRIHTLASDAHRLLCPPAPGEAVTEADFGAADEKPLVSAGSSADERRQADPVSLQVGQGSGDITGQPSMLQSVGSTALSGWLLGLKRLLEVVDEEEALAAELAAMAGTLLSGRGLVILFDGTRHLVARSYRMEPYQIDDISRTIIERVREHRAPYVCADVLADLNLGQLRSLRAARVRSILCYPILRDNACLGVVYVDHLEAGGVTTPQASEVAARIAELSADLLAASLRRHQQPASEDSAFGLIGTSPPMVRLQAQLRALAESNSPDLVVLLLGETGTGKSMIARALHAGGRRQNDPFISINTASIPETLFESLMLGYARGAFTGATNSQAGWFEMARGGTLFLDEIGEMPLTQQVRLLETLSSRQFRRLGDLQEQLLDVHLICATSRELKAEVTAGRFRAELLRRIQVNTCRVPPLRERGADDIRLLARHMITAWLRQQGMRHTDAPLVPLEDFLTRPAQEFLYTYAWPWNVGEMENLFCNEGLRRTLRTNGREKVALEQVLEALDQAQLPTRLEVPQAENSPPQGLSYKDLDAWYERQKLEYIARVHRACGGKVAHTARQLDCGRDLIYKYLGRGEASDDEGEGEGKRGRKEKREPGR